MGCVLRLCSRYYSCTVLDSIHRSLAIEEWAKYQRFTQRAGPNVSNVDRLNGGMRLERALGAFDMFMLHDNEGDLDEVRNTCLPYQHGGNWLTGPLLAHRFANFSTTSPLAFVLPTLISTGPRPGARRLLSLGGYMPTI